MASIVKKDNPALRKISSDVELANINTEKTKKILSNMENALEKEEDGVALAAPQIGVSLRIFIVSPKAFVPPPNPKEKNFGEEQKVYKERLREASLKEHLIFINPKIIKRSKEAQEMEEGCLSIRSYYGKVKRSTRATVRAYDEEGLIFTRGASGLLSQIFQHEIDHLDGILFTDKAKDVREYRQE